MIRKAELTDLENILNLYFIGRNFMRANGNLNQWINGYPQKSLLIEDINSGYLYVEDESGELTGVFAFILGADPTYSYIEKGKWKNDNPYGTIHRIASNGKKKGFLERAVNFCLQFTDTLRADTHADNLPMQKALKKNGFDYCGIIYISDGSPRLAFCR